MLDCAWGGAHAVLAVAILANGALGMAVVLVTRFPEHPALLRALLPFGVVGLNRSLTLVLSLLLVYLAFEVYERRRAAWWAAAEAQEVSGEWLSLPGRRERAFALGRFGRGYLSRGSLVLARDRTGRLMAFLNEVPGIRAGVATIDLMRHRRETPNGLMDYVFGELLLRLREEGYGWFSLGLAPLAGSVTVPAPGCTSARSIRSTST